MTLGDLINQLAAVPPDTIVNLGRPRSYRGYYDQLAFARVPGATAGQMLKEARAAVGATFEGYKGGQYVMDRATTCWVAEWGEAGEEDEMTRADLFPSVPGDAFADAWLKAGEALLAKKNAGTATPAELAVLADAKIHAQSIAVAPEVADDESTLFTDESRRPQLDGADYLAEQKKRDCEDFAQKAAAFMEKHGAEALDFAIKLGMTLVAAQAKR